MKMNLIAGIMSLGLGIALPAAAPNYYLQIGGDNTTCIADHASWEQGHANTESFESYNLGLPDRHGLY